MPCPGLFNWDHCASCFSFLSIWGSTRPSNDCAAGGSSRFPDIAVCLFCSGVRRRVCQRQGAVLRQVRWPSHGHLAGMAVLQHMLSGDGTSFVTLVSVPPLSPLRARSLLRRYSRVGAAYASRMHSMLGVAWHIPARAWREQTQARLRYVSCPHPLTAWVCDQ